MKSHPENATSPSPRDKEEALQTLTTKIQKHCPELTGLHLFEIGYAKCKYCDTPRIVRDERHKTVRVDEKTGGSIGEVTVTEYDQTDMPCTRNFWKPITLEHVLKAIGKDDRIEYRMIAQESLSLKIGYDSVYWQMNKPLSDQSPETIEWLNGVID